MLFKSFHIFFVVVPPVNGNNKYCSGSSYVLLSLDHHTRMVPTYVLPVVTNSVVQGGSAYEEALLFEAVQ